MHIDLSELAEEKGFVIEKDSNRDTDIVDTCRLFETLDDIIKTSEKPVIIDGHYAHDFIPTMNNVMVFVLRRAPWLLYDVLKHRGYSEEKIWENIDSEIIGVCATEARQNHDPVCELDTTDSTVKETAEKIKNITEEKESCPQSNLDWLTYKRTIYLLKERR